MEQPIVNQVPVNLNFLFQMRRYVQLGTGRCNMQPCRIEWDGIVSCSSQPAGAHAISTRGRLTLPFT